jgi:hypothetical protein
LIAFQTSPFPRSDMPLLPICAGGDAGENAGGGSRATALTAELCSVPAAEDGDWVCEYCGAEY